MQWKREILLFFNKKKNISALSKPQSTITRVSSCADKPDFVLNCQTACTFFFLFEQRTASSHAELQSGACSLRLCAQIIQS